MTELQQCRCGYDINLTFTIQQLWQGHGDDVYIAFCSRCKEVAAFTACSAYYDMSKRIHEAAVAAWNEKQEGRER